MTSSKRLLHLFLLTFTIGRCAGQNSTLDPGRDFDTNHNNEVGYVFTKTPEEDPVDTGTDFVTSIETSGTDRRSLARYRYRGPLLEEREKLAMSESLVERAVEEAMHGGREEVEGHIQTAPAEDAGKYHIKDLPPPRSPPDQARPLNDQGIFGPLRHVSGDELTDECALRSWNQWSSWTSCSSYCGFAYRLQVRECVFQDPFGEKKDCGKLSYRKCKGKDFKTENCDGLPQCAVTTYWAPWSACSAVCQGQAGTRHRVKVTESSKGTVTRLPESIQREACQGSRSDCMGWSGWSRCSVSCSNQVGVRERMLVVMTTDGFYRRDASRLEMEPCVGNRLLCEDWSPWSPWSKCDCRTGHRARHRKCQRKFALATYNHRLGLTVDARLCPGPSFVLASCLTAARSQCHIRIQEKIRKKLVRAKKRAMSRKSRVKMPIRDCVTSCAGLRPGRFPSCKSCFHYWQCHRRRQGERMCAKRRKWDDKAKRCLPWSATCPGF